MAARRKALGLLTVLIAMALVVSFSQPPGFAAEQERELGSAPRGRTAPAVDSGSVLLGTGSGSISGTVAVGGGTLPYGQVEVLTSAGEHVAWIWIEDGAYTAPDLAPGSYLIWFRPSTVESPLDEWFDDARSIAEATPIEVGEGESVTGIDARLEVPATIRGRVTDGSGDPVSDVVVFAYEQSASPFREPPMGVSAPDGTYEVRRMPPGSYRLEFVDPYGVVEFPDRFVTVAEGATLEGVDAAGAYAGRERLGDRVPIDTSDRDAVARAYRFRLLRSLWLDVPTDWDGDVAGCRAGTLSDAYQDSTEAAINYFRAMVDETPIVLEASRSARAQEAALMMTANGRLSHYPDSTWDCYTAVGARAAGSSNLYLGRYGPWAMYGYIEDPGSNNAPVGHRRWILSPGERVMGSGTIPYSSNALWTVYATGVWPHRSPAMTSWPPSGFVPADLAFPRWSFHLEGSADFSSASVEMTADGLTVPLTVIHRDTGSSYGYVSAIVWEPVLPVRSGDQVVEVSVRGVVVDGVSTDYSYTVTLFDAAPPDFTDIWSSSLRDEIRLIQWAEITLGCNPPANDYFCPTRSVTRGQMASFLARAFDLPATSDDYFSDDGGSTHEDNINRVAEAGITLGCDDTGKHFCPDELVTRAQMASFIARAMGLEPIPGNRFDDVSGPHTGNINAIADARITLGCNPDGTLYCPAASVTRAQMAAFLARALDL